ncbi:MAG: hypothetical protein QXT45_03680 [Candidatus Bilamarchaeaceae archaeon]
MADQKQKALIKKPAELEAVPIKKETEELIARLREINSAFEEASAQLKNAHVTLADYYDYEKGKTGFLFGWLSFAYNHSLISLFPPNFAQKKEMSYADKKKVNAALAEGAVSLKKMFGLLPEAEKLLEKIEKSSGATAIKTTYDYLYLVGGTLFLTHLFKDQFENGAKAAEMEYTFIMKIKPNQPVISAQKGEPIPIEDAPLLELPSTTIDLLTYGPRQVYFDPYTGTYGPKEMIELARDVKTGKKKIEIDLDDFLLLLPIVGPGACVINDIKMIREGAPTEKKIGGAMLVLDVIFAGLDTQWLIHLGARSVAKTIGRDALVRMSEEKATGALVTKTEQDIFMKAASELDDKKFKKLLEISQKKSWRTIAEEVAKMAGNGSITKKVFEEYLTIEKGRGEKWLKSYLGEMYRDLSVFISDSMFEKNIRALVIREIVHGTDLKTLRALGKELEGLPVKEKEVAISAIFNSIMSFSPSAQRALLDFVKKKGWRELYSKVEGVVRDLGGSKAIKALREGRLEQRMLAEATKTVLQKEVKEYSFAYKLAPFKELAKLSALVGFAHGVFTTVRALGEYMVAKTEEKAKAIEDKIRKYEQLATEISTLPEEQPESELVETAAEMFSKGAKGE